MKKSFLKIFSLLAIAIVFVSCDKDFNTVGSDVVGDDHFNLEKVDYDVVSYNKATGPVQTNNLSINAFGVYENPAFGATTASFVTQLGLTRTYENPKKILGENFTIEATDSVYLYIPYFATDTEVVDENTKLKIYELDSIYGDKNTTFDLKIYENGYFLNDYNPGEDFVNSQKFYSNDFAKFDSNIGQQLNTSSDIYQNTNFKFNSNEIVYYKSKLLDNGTYVFVDSDGEPLASQSDLSVRVIKDRALPGMWINLDKNVIKQRILEASQNGKLFNNNIFREYFRGLYFKVTQTSPGTGALAMLDFSKGFITIQYHSDITITDSNGVPQTNNAKRTLKLNLLGNTVNLINNANNSSYSSALAASDEVNGDSKLFIKGNEGSVAFIDMFKNPSELEDLRADVKAGNWLINEAYLNFYIDRTAMSSASIYEPHRIYLFDATNNKPIIDYLVDPSQSQNSKFDKFSKYGGIIEREDVDNGRGIKYRIKVSTLIKNILKSDNEDNNKNVRLGLSVTENIKLNANGVLKNPIMIGASDEVKLLPIASFMSPVGTILYGSNIPSGDVNEDKKLKLEIYFTKPNN